MEIRDQRYLRAVAYLKPSEIDALKERAAELGVNQSTYLRMLVLQDAGVLVTGNA